MDALIGFINANMVLIGFVWGLVCKYVPALKAVPNWAIPWVNLILTFLTGLAGPAVAHAGIGGLVGGGSLFGSLLVAGWTAIKSALIYEVLARHPLTAAGWKKA